MSYPNTRWWAKQQGDQNKSPHDQAPSSSNTGQATSGGSANLTPYRSPKDQGNGGQEAKGNIVSWTALKPRLAPPRMSSGPPTPSPTNSEFCRSRAMTRAPWVTRIISRSPSPIGDIPWSPSITSMMMDRERQHDGKDPYHFYEHNDSEREIDYPATPSYSDNSSTSRSGSSSVWSNQSDRSERGGTPSYGESGWRSGNFFTTQRR